MIAVCEYCGANIQDVPEGVELSEVPCEGCADMLAKPADEEA